MECILKNGKIVTLREVVVEDAQKLLEYFLLANLQTKNLMREPEEFTMTVEDETKFIKNATGSNDDFMGVAIFDDKIIAAAGFRGSSLKRVNHRVSMGISVLEEFFNLGLASFLMEFIIKKAKDLGKTKMELEVRIDNLNAIHLYKKFDFFEEGIRKNGFFVDNKFVDLLLMGKTL